MKQARLFYQLSAKTNNPNIASLIYGGHLKTQIAFF